MRDISGNDYAHTQGRNRTQGQAAANGTSRGTNTGRRRDADTQPIDTREEPRPLNSRVVTPLYHSPTPRAPGATGAPGVLGTPLVGPNSLTLFGYDHPSDLPITLTSDPLLRYPFDVDTISGAREDEAMPLPASSARRHESFIVDTGTGSFLFRDFDVTNEGDAYLPNLIRAGLSPLENFFSIAAGMGPSTPDDGDSMPTTFQALVHRVTEQSEAAAQRQFALDFKKTHTGSVNAMRALVDELRARDVSVVPKGGVTCDDIDTRSPSMTYKLPALLLAQHLTDICEGEGELANIRLFDTGSQKPVPKGTPSHISMLPEIYRHLLSMHGNNKQALTRALPLLQPRVAGLVETGSASASPQEKHLVQLINNAAYFIQGEILCCTLGTACDPRL